MGKQISFIIDEETEHEFVKQLVQDGQVLFEVPNSELQVINSLPEAYSSEDWFTVYFYKSKFGDLHYRLLPNGQRYIDSSKSPVIEFIRTVIRHEEREISRGRLWVEPKYWDDNDEVQGKPKELIQWFNNMSKWIKKNVPQHVFDSHEYQYKEHISSNLMPLITDGYRIY